MAFRMYPNSSPNTDESFVTVEIESGLVDSRVITAGPGVSLTDTGTEIIVGAAASPGSGVKYVVLGADPSVPNARILTPGAFINITDMTTTVVVAASGVAPENAQYITWGSDPILTNERIITAGAGIGFTDNGTNWTISVDSSVTRNTASQTLTNKTLISPVIYEQVVTTSVNYGALATDRYILVDASGGVISVTVPTASSGKLYSIKKIDSTPNDVNITAPGTIDSAGSFVLRVSNDSVDIVSNGSDWFVV